MSEVKKAPATRRRLTFPERLDQNMAISFRPEGLAPFLAKRLRDASPSVLVRDALHRYWLLCEAEARDLPDGLDYDRIADDLRPHMPLDPAGIFGVADLVHDKVQRALIRRMSRAQRCALVDVIEINEAEAAADAD